MPDYYYWEEPEPSSVSYESYMRLQKEYEDLKEKYYDAEDDRDWFKSFIKKFIEEGNKEDQPLSEAYARMFEVYKSEGYEDYFKEEKDKEEKRKANQDR